MIPFRLAWRLPLLAALAATAGSCAPKATPQDPAATQAEIARLYQSYRKDFPDVQGITPNELADLQSREPVVVVDVREPRERAVSRIPGSITREQFEAEKATVAGKPVVVYCTIGYRSGQYCEQLKKDGIPARNLEGSILAWVNAGQPVVDSTGAPTKRVHTYGRQWALLPKGYEAVY